MNLDDPKLTAFALDELAEPERSTVAREVADSPEAQRFVDETREVARALQNEFANELIRDGATPFGSRSGGFVRALEGFGAGGQAADYDKRRSGERRSLSDIRDDPWFWSIARPLAIAAAITVFFMLGAIMMGNYKWRSDSGVEASDYTDVVAEQGSSAEAPPAFRGPATIPNPLPPETIQQVERVVIGELDPQLETGEIRMIEVISDANRVQRLKTRLTTPVLSKQSHQGFVGRAYKLMFLDRSAHVVASAGFYWSPGFGFVLQPSEYGYERDGRYFSGGGNAILPGKWASDIDYLGYVIPFPDWADGIGYSPGA